ncbi:MAG: baseplate J/gp47 family protein [Gemmatimonadaceae bacterium]
MTFVAQPFEQIAYDLLTELTGGVAREEHQFIGSGETYGVASPDVIPESISVSGQVGTNFVRFDRDIDYALDFSSGTIKWKDGGSARHPDERSYFYMNYYRSETPRRLTDRNPGSVTFLLATAFAREFAVLQKQMAFIYESAFVDLATGMSLDHVAALLGITRKDARFAVGEVVFVRDTPAPGDISIAAGTVVATERGETFETVERRTLSRGQLAVSASIRAMVEGTAGRVDARTIKIINRPIFGIDGVVNREATAFATEKESDEALRRRIRGALERAGKASLEAIKLALLEQVPGLNDTNVQVVERQDAAGLVDVKFGLGDAVDSELVRRVDEAILSARAAGIRVTHNLPRPGGVSASQPGLTLIAEGARPPLRLAPEVVARSATGVLDLQVAVLVRLLDPALSAAQKDAVESEVRSRVTGYFEALPMGAPVIHSKLLGAVIGHDAIADAIVRLGAAGATAPEIEANLDTDGRKARVAAASVAVSLMAEPVMIDVLVRLAAGTPPAAAADVDALRLALEVISTAGARLLAVQDVQTAASAALATRQLAANEPVVLNATYADTGRQLVNAERIELAEHHVARWRNVTVQGEDAG